MRENASETWAELVNRYRRYRALPFWGTKTFRPDERGVLSAEQLAAMRHQGEAAVERVTEAIRRLKKDSSFPRNPRQLGQPDLDRITRNRLIPQRLRETLFAALILDRGGYTCRYCGRNVNAVWEESGHRWTIRLEIDHLRPRVLRGGDWLLDNSVPACQRCNLAKGSLPEGSFLEELRSIAKSVSLRDGDTHRHVEGEPLPS